MTSSASASYVALSGGVGGAKLALGLCDVLEDPSRLTVVANTGDDFEHLGLKVCPDLDTLTYTLSGLANEETGWGRAGESGAFMEALGALGGETWFFLGDKDLAIHVERTRRLQAGESLSAVTAALCARLGVPARIVPMSDDPVPTVVETPEGPLAFQHYFVRERCRPAVLGFRYEGAERARPCAAFVDALAAPDLGAVVVCPSNPYISIDPILAVPGVRAALTGLQGAGDRGFPDRRRAGGQGAHGQDDGGARHRAERSRDRRALRRADRRARHRRDRSRRGGGDRRHRRRCRGHGHDDDRADRKAGSCAGRARVRGAAPRGRLARTMVRCSARAMCVSIASCSTRATAPRFIPFTVSVATLLSGMTAAARTALSRLEPL